MYKDYRDFKISYVEHGDTWKGKNAEEVELSSTDGLSGLKKKIDKHISAECKSKKINVLTWGQWSDREKMEVVTITSIDESGDMWIKRPDNSRNKLSSYACVYVDNESNKKVVQELYKINNEIAEKNKERTALINSLEQYVIESLKES
jgi:hypothetical protein